MCVCNPSRNNNYRRTFQIETNIPISRRYCSPHRGHFHSPRHHSISPTHHFLLSFFLILHLQLTGKKKLCTFRMFGKRQLWPRFGRIFQPIEHTHRRPSHNNPDLQISKLFKFFFFRFDYTNVCGNEHLSAIQHTVCIICTRIFMYRWITVIKTKILYTWKMMGRSCWTAETYLSIQIAVEWSDGHQIFIFRFFFCFFFCIFYFMHRRLMPDR